MALGILFLVAAIVAAFWKSEHYRPAVVRETRTIKGWVATVLVILAVICFAAFSGDPTSAPKSKKRAVVPEGAFKLAP